MHSRLDGQSGNVGTHDGQRCAEILDFQPGESDVLKHVTRRAIGMASITHAAPRRPDGRLDAPQYCSTRGGNVFNENESAAGSEHSMYFADSSFRVDNAAKDERADYGVDGSRFDWQVLRSPRAQIDDESDASGLVPEVLGHVRVRLHSDPANALAYQVAQVCPGTRAYLQHRAGKIGKETLLVGSKVIVGFMSEVRHEPSERAETDGTGSSADFAEGGLLLARRVLQCFNYTASNGQPP